MKKRILKQAESSSFSIGVTNVSEQGATISVRPFQNLNNTPNGQSQFDYNEGGFFTSFYSHGQTPSASLLNNLFNGGKTRDISRFFPARSVPDPENLNFMIPGFGEFDISQGINYLILCLPCQCVYDGPTDPSLVSIGYPTANLGDFATNYTDSLRLDIFSSPPPTKLPTLFDPFSNTYRWQYYLPLAKITLGSDISVVNYDIGFMEFGVFSALISDINNVAIELPLHLLSSYFEQ